MPLVARDLVDGHAAPLLDFHPCDPCGLDEPSRPVSYRLPGAASTAVTECRELEEERLRRERSAVARPRRTRRKASDELAALRSKVRGLEAAMEASAAGGGASAGASRGTGAATPPKQRRAAAAVASSDAWGCSSSMVVWPLFVYVSCILLIREELVPLHDSGLPPSIEHILSV